jgi:hypothetical protein
MLLISLGAGNDGNNNSKEGSASMESFPPSVGAGAMVYGDGDGDTRGRLSHSSSTRERIILDSLGSSLSAVG